MNILKNKNFKTYKYIFKSLILNDESICLKNRKHVKIIAFKDIDKIELSIPMYNSISGSGLEYTYTFDIFELNTSKHRFSIVLERYEEKEIIEYLQEKNINLSIGYYDNKYGGTD